MQAESWSWRRDHSGEHRGSSPGSIGRTERFLRSDQLRNSARLLSLCARFSPFAQVVTQEARSRTPWGVGSLPVPVQWPCSFSVCLLLRHARSPAPRARRQSTCHGLRGGPGAQAGGGSLVTQSASRPPWDTPFPGRPSFGACFPLDSTACTARRPPPASCGSPGPGRRLRRAGPHTPAAWTPNHMTKPRRAAVSVINTLYFLFDISKALSQPEKSFSSIYK